jgi:glycosyltransferase involved in cell wall biosynthesis
MNVPASARISDTPFVTRRTCLPVLADSWYAYKYPDICEPFDSLLEQNFPAWVIWLAGKFGIVRGWLLFLAGKNRPFLLTSAAIPGAKAFFFFEALLGERRKHVILVEFIHAAKPKSRSIFKFWIYHLWLHLVLKRALRKSLLTAHVLTDWERSHYAELFEVPEERFFFIPWPKRLRVDRLLEPSPASAERSVMSSGREACDWETLFKAAEGQGWRLRIVCSRSDVQRVRRLNRGGIAEVFCEISFEDHQSQLETAAVYVLSLYEGERSSGHVRINNATRAGIPIVATSVKGIEGYIEDGDTGLLVPPGDALRLRAAVNRLLSDVKSSRVLARNAFDRAAKHTREDYMEKLGLFIRGAIQGGYGS